MNHTTNQAKKKGKKMDEKEKIEKTGDATHENCKYQKVCAGIRDLGLAALDLAENEEEGGIDNECFMSIAKLASKIKEEFMQAYCPARQNDLKDLFSRVQAAVVGRA